MFVNTSPLLPSSTALHLRVRLIFQNVRPRWRQARGFAAPEGMVLWVSALRADTHSTMHNLRAPQARACERHGTQTLSEGRVNVHREKVTAFPGRVQDL